MLRQTRSRKRSIGEISSGNIELGGDQRSDSVMDDGHAGMLQKICKSWEKAHARSEQGEPSDRPGHQLTEPEQILLVDPVLSEDLQKFTDAARPRALSHMERELQDGKGDLKGDARRNTLRHWRKIQRLIALSHMMETLTQPVDRESLDEETSKDCASLFKKLHILAHGILERYPQALPDIIGGIQENTNLARLAVTIRALHMEPRIEETTARLQQALQRPDLNHEELQEYQEDLNTFKFMCSKKNRREIFKRYWKLKEQAESPLLQETGPTATQQDQTADPLGHLTETQKVLLQTWQELTFLPNPAEEALKKKGYRSQGEGEDIKQGLLLNRTQGSARTEFMITPLIETFQRNSEAESSQRPTLKEVGEVEHSRIETALRKSLTSPLKKQWEENISRIATLDQHIKDLEQGIEETPSLREEIEHRKQERVDRKDANRHLQAAYYHAQTGEQPFGYKYKIVTRFYDLENKSAQVLKRIKGESSQIIVFNEIQSIADKYDVNHSNIHDLLKKDVDSVIDTEGGVWKRCLGPDTNPHSVRQFSNEGQQDEAASTELVLRDANLYDTELLPETETFMVLEDYRPIHAKSTEYKMIIDEKNKQVTITHQAQLLSYELGKDRSFIKSILNLNNRLKQPEHIKFIIPHQYKKGITHV